MARLNYKVEGSQVLWYNGQKWLVKETCSTPEEAQTICDELNSQ